MNQPTRLKKPDALYEISKELIIILIRNINDISRIILL